MFDHNIVFKLNSAVNLKFKTQFCVRPLERPLPLCGAQDGDLERGGVQEEGRGVCYWLYERRGYRGRDTHTQRVESEEGILFFLNGNPEHTEEKGRTQRNQKSRQKSGDLFYARGKQGNELNKGKEEREEKKHWGFFFSIFGSFHSHDSKRIPVKITQSGGIDGVFSG